MLQLLDDKVAIRPLSDPDKIGLIIIPEMAKRRSDQGVIIYRGPNVKELKVGDHVLFPAYSGSRIVVEDEGHFLIMPEEEIVAILGEGEKVFTLIQVGEKIERAWESLSIENQTGEIRSYIHSLIDEFHLDAVRQMEN